MLGMKPANVPYKNIISRRATSTAISSIFTCQLRNSPRLIAEPLSLWLAYLSMLSTHLTL